MREAATVMEALVPALFLLLLVGVAALVVPMRYRIGPGELSVQTRFLEQRIPLGAIRRVYPSRSVLPGPAWPLDRLAVEYQDGRYSRPTIYISPRHKERFVEEPATAAGLVREGTEWVRPDSARVSAAAPGHGDGSP